MATATTIERIDHLSDEERALVCALAASRFRDLDAAASWLYVLFPSWLVYHGGSYLALHCAQNDNRRVAIIVEEPLAQAA